MPRYKAVKACTFQGRYWERGDILTLDKPTLVPEHFVKLDGDKAPQEAPPPRSKSKDAHAKALETAAPPKLPT